MNREQIRRNLTRLERKMFDMAWREQNIIIQPGGHKYLMGAGLRILFNKWAALISYGITIKNILVVTDALNNCGYWTGRAVL